MTLIRMLSNEYATYGAMIASRSFGSAFGTAHPNEIARNSHTNMPTMTTHRTTSARTRSEHHAPTV